MILNLRQISWLTHSSPQFFTLNQWANFMRVHKSTRAKVALALEFKGVILAVLSQDLLVQVTPYLLFLFLECSQHFIPQFRWGKPGDFEIKNSVIDNFDTFVETVCKWIRIKVLPQINKAYEDTDNGSQFGKSKINKGDYATKTIRDWNEVFYGFGVYSVQEVFFRAGLSHLLLPKSFAQ